MATQKITPQTRYFKSPNLLVFLAIAALGFLIYSNSLESSFHLDDKTTITTNQNLHKLHSLKDIKTLFKSNPGLFLSYLTLALNYQYAGTEPFGYHVFNLLIHILTSYLVYIFVLLLFQTDKLRKTNMTKHAQKIACLAALIFLVHPIQTQAVIYITQRKTLLAALFYLLTLNLYVKARLTNQVWFFVLAGFTTMAAMFTKETVFTLPIMIGVYEFLFFIYKKRARGKQLLTFLLFASSMLIIPLGRLFHFASKKGVIWFNLTAQTALISREHYLFTQFNVIRTYLRLLVLPIAQNLDYDYPISTTLFECSTFFSLLLLIALILFAFWIFKRNRLLSFCIAWFLITLSVESSLIPLNDVIFEHRLYLPMVGFSIFLAIVIVRLKDGGSVPWRTRPHNKSSPKSLIRDLDSRESGNDMLYVVLYFLIISILSILTINRSRIWNTDITLWEDVVQKSPDKARALHNLGNAYASQKQFEKALPLFKRAVELEIKNPSADPQILALHSFALGSCHFMLKDYDSAIWALEKAAALSKPKSYLTGLTWVKLGDAYFAKNNKRKAFEYYREAKKISFSTPEFQGSLFQYYRSIGDTEKMEYRYKKLKKIYSMDDRFGVEF